MDRKELYITSAIGVGAGIGAASVAGIVGAPVLVASAGVIVAGVLVT